MKTGVVWLFSLIALFPARLPAGDHSLTEPQVDQSTEPLVVLTPSRLPQPLDESASAVTVIDRAMIEASGARRLVDVLRLVPGFAVGIKINSLPTAAYHGLNDEYARRTLLLINGQRIFQYARGVITWNNLPVPLENVERIEIIRGPDAAAYGSNALQAVINIQTGSPSEYKGASTRLTGGTAGIHDAFLRYGGRLGNLDYMVSASSTGEDGYEDVYDTRRNNVFSFIGEIPLASGEIQLQAGFARGQNQLQHPEPVVQAPSREFPETNHYQTLRWRHALDPDTEWTATLSHNLFTYRDRGFTNDRIIPGVILNFDYTIDEERYEADIQYFRRFSEQLRSVLSVGYYHEMVYSPYYFNTENTLDNTVSWIGGHVEYRLNSAWIFNFGSLLEHSSLTDSWLWLPRASAHYHLDDRQTLRLSYATGSRQPTLYENGGHAVIQGVNIPLNIHTVIASGGLEPEINRSLEAGYHWEIDRTQFDLRFFQERYSDYIGTYYRPAPGLMTAIPGLVLDFANESPIDVRGLEAQWDWRSSFGTRLFASYALTEIDADGAQFDAGYAKTSPRHGLSFLIVQDFADGWQTSINYDYQSKMQWYRDVPIKSYHQLGLRLAKSFKLGSSLAKVEAIGSNLLEPVADYLPSQVWNRTLFFRLNLDF